MKIVLILCLTALAGTTSWSLNERMLSVPAGVQRQRPRRLLYLPRTTRREMQRLFYLKNLLELNCLRHLCSGSSSQCKGSKCPSAVKASDRSHHEYNRIRLPPYRRRYPSGNRVIIVPPNFYFINPRMEGFSRVTQKTSQGANLVKDKTENVIYVGFPGQNTEESRTAEDQNLKDKLSLANGDDLRKQNNTPTTLHSYWQEPPPNQVRQYEVEEIIDEDPLYLGANPFFIIPKATDEALTEEFKNKSNGWKNDKHNSSTKETGKNFSNHKSRELVDEKEPQIRQEEEKYIKITPPVQKTQSTEQPTTNSKRPDMSALPSDLLESLEILMDEPDTEKSTPENVKPSTVSFQTKVVSKGLRELITAGKTNPGTEWTFPEVSDTSPSVVNTLKTVEYFSEATVNKADLTTPDFREFTDEAFLFDLIPKAKSKDPAWKNSRKMHFGDSPKPEEQRRSDILINDDYYEYENTFPTSNLNHNLSLSFDLPKNPSPDDIIPLIPVVIGDLRENKIPQEALPVLSELFGKYWPAVIALSNATNLDMLPLLKMKNEKDLDSILESAFPVSSEQATTTTTTTRTTTTTTDKNLYYDLYDYDVDNFGDLYKDFGGIQEVWPTDKRKRFGKVL